MRERLSKMINELLDKGYQTMAESSFSRVMRSKNGLYMVEINKKLGCLTRYQKVGKPQYPK